MIQTQTHEDAPTATHSKRFVIDDELARLPACERIAAIRLDRVRRVAGLPERPVILDLGCGSGLYVAAFTRAGCDVVGVEPHAPTREAAAQIGERLGIELRISDGHAEHIPFEDASFDFVYCNQVIEHVADPAASFAEVARVLRPGGGVLVQRHQLALSISDRDPPVPPVSVVSRPSQTTHHVLGARPPPSPRQLHENSGDQLVYSLQSPSYVAGQWFQRGVGSLELAR